MSTTKVRIDLKSGAIELEGDEKFVCKYLDELKEFLLERTDKLFLNGNNTRKDITDTADITEGSVPKKKEKRPAKKRTTPKKSPANISPERFEIHGEDGKPSLEAFFEEKDPVKSNNGVKIAIIGYYISEILDKKSFTEGHIEYAYRMLKLKRPTHLRQIIINEKNKRDLFEQDEDGSGVWKLTRTGEIFVSDQLPEQSE